MKTIKIIKKILAKRKESSSANAGFIGGCVAGIITAIFSLIVLILNKELFFQELALAMNKYGFTIPIPNETIWILSLVVTPPVIILIYSIVGIFMGLFFKRFEKGNYIIILLLSAAVGAVWGLITNLPANRLSIIIVNISAWLTFGIIFLVFRKKVELK